MRIIHLTLFLFLANFICAQEEIKLYKYKPKESNGIIVAESNKRPDFYIDISKPRMYCYPAKKEMNTRTAVLICPGGGYAGVSVIKEGEEIARWFNDFGVNAFVLYYRRPNGHTSIPLTDARTALKIIHKGAKKWGIDKNKIGIMGFSAGGHLASTVGTHFRSNAERPAFMILGYPVVTMMMDYTHMGSRNNLLGKNPLNELVDAYSNELRVSRKTPPTYIFHASDDRAVPIKNSVQFYQALKKNDVVARLDTFPVGGHGFGMRKSGIDADKWPELLKIWLKENNIIE